MEGDVSLDDLNEGVRPGHSRFMGSYGSSASDYDTNQYNEDLKKFRKMALGGSGVQSGSQPTPTADERVPAEPIGVEQRRAPDDTGNGDGEREERRRQR